MHKDAKMASTWWRHAVSMQVIIIRLIPRNRPKQHPLQFGQQTVYLMKFLCLHLQGEFTWNRQFQGHLLSSYFYGYIVTGVLGGWLSGRYGGKHVMATGILVSVLATLLTPVGARSHQFVVMALRVLLGAGSVSFRQVYSIRIE